MSGARPIPIVRQSIFKCPKATSLSFSALHNPSSRFSLDASFLLSPAAPFWFFRSFFFPPSNPVPYCCVPSTCTPHTRNKAAKERPIRKRPAFSPIPTPFFFLPLLPIPFPFIPRPPLVFLLSRPDTFLFPSVTRLASSATSFFAPSTPSFPYPSILPPCASSHSFFLSLFFLP